MAPKVSDKPIDRLLIALQFWKGDRDAAMRVASFIADMELRHTNLADMVLVNRFDCPPADQSVIEKVSRKFNVFTYTSPQRGVGWPDGCNGLWFGSMEWAFSFMEVGRLPHYKAIFTCEADGAPVYRDWVARMSQAWEATQLSVKPVYIAGPLVGAPPHVEEHVNGNCLISGNFKFLHWITRRVSGVPAAIGWDYYLRSAFKQWGWCNIPGMVSYYNTPRFTPEQYVQMLEQDLIWVHGDKSNSLVDMGRAKWQL